MTYDLIQQTVKGTIDNINFYSSEDFLCYNFQHQSMSQNHRQNQRWKKLGYDNQKLPERSVYSRDSSMHSKYTPTKKQIKSPDQKLNLATLQNRITSVKQFSNQQSNQQQSRVNQSNIGSPTTYFNLVNRTNSIETQNPTPVNLEKRGITRNNYKNLSKEKHDQILNQYYEKQQVRPSYRNSHKPKRSSEQGSLIKPYELGKINGLLGKKASFQSQYDDQPFPTENLKRSPVEINLQNYLSLLQLIEKDMKDQRFFIQTQLQEKQRQFIKVKEQILKLFGKHEKKIQDPILRQAIEEYIPKQQQKNNALMRVTSQKIFNRISTLNYEMRSSVMGPNGSNMQSNTERTLKLADFRSVKSRQSSAFKQNFNTIFETLNQMKKGLDDTDPTTSKQINTTKQLAVPATPTQQKTLKKSLLLLKNEKKEKQKQKNSNQKQQMDKVNKQVMYKITELFKTPSLSKIT